ncbi:aldo/keto reductase [Kribbella sp. CA-293567]|uniref:aldo/keto reductase n=1 Tax=Kribbella sp. CA-293567 TaxID=3002436 RepID=UPI0022DE23D1|nr:aldo/keto reductase [Kribbella sp. CA-293567]WBQ03344.1 aldo/keto reductase [Kribbella sp. CA-293567]
MHRTDVDADLSSNLASGSANRKTANPVETWKLGEQLVNRIGFGAKRLGGSGPIAHRTPDTPTAVPDARPDSERVTTLLRRAVELGVNHLDTAAFYPSYGRPGEQHGFHSLDWANDAIRRALTPYADDLFIATKVGPTEHGLARPDQLRQLVEDNLRQLGLETLDLVYLRQHGLTSVAEHFGVLAELRQAGLIRHLGLSNIRPGHLPQAQEIAPVIAVQNRYGVGFGRINDGLLAACGEQGIAFVPFFAVTATGREEGGVADTDPVVAISRDHGATPAQIRIAWTLAKGPHVLAIPGTSNPGHLAENLAAGSITLSPGQLATLDAIPSD